MPRLVLLVALTVFAVSLLLLPSEALASSAGMPWESAFTKAMRGLTGPTAKALGGIAFFSFGVGLAFSQGQGTWHKAFWILLGLAIAFNAGTWGLSLMGFSGGLTV